MKTAEQTITPFGDTENEWLKISLDDAQKITGVYGHSGIQPADLDSAFSSWMKEGRKTFIGETVAHGLGAAFGKNLCDTHGFEWVVLEDQYGRDFAVRCPQTGVMGFPVDSVIKRTASRETQFIESSLAALLRTREDALAN